MWFSMSEIKKGEEILTITSNLEYRATTLPRKRNRRKGSTFILSCNIFISDLFDFYWVKCTIVIHHWESGHASLDKHRKCIVHSGRLWDCGYVCESSYSCIFNLHLQEAWLGHWGFLEMKRKSDLYTNLLNFSNRTKNWIFFILQINEGTWGFSYGSVCEGHFQTLGRWPAACGFCVSAKSRRHQRGCVRTEKMC